MARCAAFLVGAALLVVCGAPTPSLAEGPVVSQLFLVDPQGDVGAVLATREQVEAIAKKHELKGTSRVIHATVAGEQTGLLGIAIEYPDMASLLHGVATMEADPEVQKIAAEATGRLVSRSIWTDITPNPVASQIEGGPGAVQTILVDPQGNVGDFLAVTEKMNALRKRLELKGNARIMQATIAGGQSQTLAVVVEYPDLATLAQDVSTLESNPEAQAIFEENAGKFRLVSRGVWTDITP